MKLTTRLSDAITFRNKQKVFLLFIILLLEIILFFILGQLYCEARKKKCLVKEWKVLSKKFSCNNYKKIILKVIFTLVSGNSD